MVIDKSSKERLQKLTDKGLSIDERTDHLIGFLRDFQPTPDFDQALKQISESYSQLKIAYKSLSEDISSDMFKLLTEINDKKTSAIKIDVDLLAKEKEGNRRYCSIYSKIPPLSSLKDDADYAYFLGKYQEGTKLSQEIAALNLKVVHLLDVQKELDSIFAGNMIEIDYLMRRINETIKTFRYIKTPDLIENYKSRHCFYKNLQSMVEAKNREFHDVLKKNSHILPASEVIDLKPE